MVAFGHTALGSIVGVASFQLFQSHPLPIALIETGALGIASHYVADFIPHGHFIKFKDFRKKIFQVIMFDLLISLMIFIFTAFSNFNLTNKFWFILFGIGGSQLPDVLDGLIFTKVIPSKGLIKIENKFHEAMHWHGKRDKALMFSFFDIWQIVTVILALILIINF